MLQDVQAALDPGDSVTIMRPGDNMPPAVALSSAALMAGLHVMAADGPAVREPDGAPGSS